MTIYENPKSYAIYSAKEIQAWEKRWFMQGNSSFGLMQQASFLMANSIENLLLKNHYTYLTNIIVWCGVGNNGGDGYLLAYYLQQKNFDVVIYAPFDPISDDCKKAKKIALDNGVFIIDNLNIDIIDQAIDCTIGDAVVHIDALFGNGLNKELNDTYRAIIYDFNRQSGLKIAIDLPSGSNPDTGVPMPVAVMADYSLCLVGLKAGLLTGQGKSYAGQVSLLPLIPDDESLTAIGTIDTFVPTLPKRVSHSHKGNFGHLLIIGGHSNMGGAVLLAGESAFACGVGKVTIMCHKNHHQAIISRSPNIMVKDIEEMFDDNFGEFLGNIDTICFGMGLGRDNWSENIYVTLLKILQKIIKQPNVILDADALYFLARYPQKIVGISNTVIATPHSAEAARLLGCTPDDIEKDRIGAIGQLYHQYGGNWVLKGAGSLVFEYNPHKKQNELSLCAFGNAGMATAGMGDVLSGMIGGLWSLGLGLSLADCVSLHAIAGDKLAMNGEWGLTTNEMVGAIKSVLN